MSAWTTEETKAFKFMFFDNPEKLESTKDSKFWASLCVIGLAIHKLGQVRSGVMVYHMYMYAS